MKKTSTILQLCMLSMLALFTACSKSHDDNAIADGTLQYKVNGNLVIISNSVGSESAKFRKDFDTLYVLTSFKDLQNQLSFYIVSNSLNAGNYAYDSATVT